MGLLYLYLYLYLRSFITVRYITLLQRNLLTYNLFKSDLKCDNIS